MIITLEPRPGARPDPPNYGMTGSASHIMCGSNYEYYFSGAMSVSIKWFFKGQSLYDVGSGHYVLDPDHYLVLNEGQPYTITVDSDEKVASLVLFFASGLAEEVCRSLAAPPDSLLDDPGAPSLDRVTFVERLYRHDDVLTPALVRLRESLARERDNHEWLDEQLRDIMTRLLGVHGQVRREVERVPALRRATREELYRRLYRARDFMYSSLGDEITLDDVAAVACLSPNHLLRTFRQVFGCTPRQYLTGLRLERAKTLLEQTGLPITEICLAVGFSSLGSFSRLFRAHAGLSPRQFRNKR